MVTRAGRALPGNAWDLLEGVHPVTPPRISVIIAHFEQQAELDRTLLALRRQDIPVDDFEVIVVDDGSSVAPRVPVGVRLIVQEDRGFRLAAARNVGARAARGGILCFLDADTSPEPAYLRELSRLPAIAPDVVTVGRRRHARLDSLPEDAPVETSAPGVELPSPKWLLDAYARSRDLLDADDRSYRFVIGAVLACDAELFAETGGFDESFDRYGGEDWEWAYRAWLHGAVFAHVSGAVAWHDGPEWAGRPERALAQKNAEAIRLSTMIPVPGSGRRGLYGALADISITTPPGTDPGDAKWFVTLDSIGASLPRAALPGDARSLTSARILVDVLRPLRDTHGALPAVIDRVGQEGLGSLTIVGSDGEPLCVVRSSRAEARGRRWGRDDLFPSVATEVPGVVAVADPVDVEAYLGGWG